ncbi:MAG: HPr kinase/phosphorylase [Alphaproteobacteria bacterium]
MHPIHATSVYLDGHGVLLRGPSGSGKSDLALRLIDAGARLIADDYTALRRAGETVIISAPPQIAGRLEVRGLGIVTLAAIAAARLSLIVDLQSPAEISRLPTPRHVDLCGLSFPALALAPFEASAPAKLRLAVASLSGHKSLADQ